jgi:hypothetical protein
MMDKPKTVVERFWKSSFPPAAVLGAFVSFITAAFRPRQESRVDAQRSDSLVQIGFAESQTADVGVGKDLEIKYTQDLILGDSASRKPFLHSLSGVAVDSLDKIYLLGDGEVRIFESKGDSIRSWRAPDKAQCFALDLKGHVYFGLMGRVVICDGDGVPIGGFPAGDGDKPANLTAIKIFGQEILAADASSRYIRRYTLNGKQLGVIGVHGKNRGFMLPNGSLDMDVDAAGLIRATDPGRHRVSSWRLDGVPTGYFGKFGQKNPQDFVGCCNPVNLAVAPDGKIVTGEKLIARVKVFDSRGMLLGLIGPEHFDSKCTHLYLAVDSKGRILVADPVNLNVKVFSASSRSGDGTNV